MLITLKFKNLCFQAWWCQPVITTLGRLRQKDHKFKASVAYKPRHCLKKKKRKNL
jgi:hypothetical protein